MKKAITSIWIIALIFILTSCPSSSSKDTGDKTDIAGTDTQKDTAVATDTYIGDTNSSGKFPITIRGITFTKTDCPNGLNWLTGRYRNYEEMTDPDANGVKHVKTPAKEDYFETVDFTGSTFEFHMVGYDDVLGKDVDAKMSGWYFCPADDELGGKKKIFVIEKLTVADAFGNTAPDQWKCDPLGEYGDFLLACDTDWDVNNTWNFQERYARCTDSACENF